MNSTVKITLQTLRRFGARIEGVDPSTESPSSIAPPTNSNTSSPSNEREKGNPAWPIADPRFCATIRKALYIQPHGGPAVGSSVIHASVVLNAMRNTFPNLVKIRVFTGRPEILVGEPDIAQIISFPEEKKYISAEAVFQRLDQELPEVQDLVMVSESEAVLNETGWRSDIDPMALKWLSESPHYLKPCLIHLGFRTSFPPELRLPEGGAWFPLRDWSQPSSACGLDLCHRDRLSAVLQTGGFDTRPPERYLDPRPLMDRGKQIFSSLSELAKADQTILIHTHTGPSPDFVDEWIALLQFLLPRKNLRIAVTVGRPWVAGDGERIERIKRGLERSGIRLDSHLLPPLGIDDLKAVLAGTDFLVSCNSGPALLAESMGIPTVVWHADRSGDGYLFPDSERWHVVVDHSKDKTTAPMIA